MDILGTKETVSEDKQSSNTKKKYRVKRKRQITAFVVVEILGLVLMLGWVFKALGEEKGVMMFIPVVVGYGIFTFKNWRCPACNKSLKRTWNPHICPTCGIKLRD